MVINIANTELSKTQSVLKATFWPRLLILYHFLSVVQLNSMAHRLNYSNEVSKGQKYERS